MSGTSFLGPMVLKICYPIAIEFMILKMIQIHIYIYINIAFVFLFFLVFSLEKRVKEIVHKAFWDCLSVQLSEDPPTYDHAIKLVGEIKEVKQRVNRAQRVFIQPVLLFQKTLKRLRSQSHLKEFGLSTFDLAPLPLKKNFQPNCDNPKTLPLYKGNVHIAQRQQNLHYEIQSTYEFYQIWTHSIYVDQKVIAPWDREGYTWKGFFCSGFTIHTLKNCYLDKWQSVVGPQASLATIFFFDYHQSFLATHAIHTHDPSTWFTQADGLQLVARLDHTHSKTFLKEQTQTNQLTFSFFLYPGDCQNINKV